MLVSLFLLLWTASREPVDAVLLPGQISTAAAEVRLAISPDGRRMLWGSIGRDAPAEQQDIWETRRTDAGWSPPARVSFDTDAVEFDPAFSPDGRRLYFHSDRPGGFGGTDLYVVDVDPKTGVFSEPRNLGADINSPGDDWAPTPTTDGRLIFASDGRGGYGKHDLFEALLSGGAARNLGPTINGSDADFDAALTRDGRTLIFSSGVMTDEEASVALFVSDRRGSGWSPRRALPVGCSPFVIGSSFDPARPERFFYAANCKDGRGRMDIREIRLPPLD